MRHNIWIYLLVMFGVVYAVRVLPLLIRRPIKSRFFRSFLYYVPYITLAVMTFPAIIDATGSPIAGAAALGVGIVLAWLGVGIFPVSVACAAVVFILECFV